MRLVVILAATALLLSGTAEAKFPTKADMEYYNGQVAESLKDADYLENGVKLTSMELSSVAHRKRLVMDVNFSVQAGLTGDQLTTAVSEIRNSHQQMACDFRVQMRKNFKQVQEVLYNIVMTQEGGAELYNEEIMCKR